MDAGRPLSFSTPSSSPPKAARPSRTSASTATSSLRKLLAAPAATGASLGQWNLSLVEAKAGPTASVAYNKRTGRSVGLILLPPFVKEYTGLPAVASRLTGIPPQQIFPLARIG